MTLIGPRIGLFGPPARLFNEPTVHVEVIPPANEQEEVDELEEELDAAGELAVQLALEEIISEERHNELIERVEQCQQRLEALSTGESPTLAALQRELQEVRSELLNLKSFMVSMQSSPTPSPSAEPEPVAVETETPVEPVPVESTEEPERVEPLPENQPPRKKNRFI